MKTIAKLGLAAALVIGSTAAFAEGAGLKAGVKAGASTSGVSTSVDATTTGSVGNYGSLISTLQAGTNADLTAFNDSSTINCVKVSSMQGSADANAQALDNALDKNQDKLTTLRSSISGNTAFVDKVEASCSMPDLDTNKIVAVESGASGQFTVYIDDRA
jgi:uncharacterized protein YlxW (UPF0749 family)